MYIPLRLWECIIFIFKYYVDVLGLQKKDCDKYIRVVYVPYISTYMVVYIDSTDTTNTMRCIYDIHNVYNHTQTYTSKCIFEETNKVESSLYTIRCTQSTLHPVDGTMYWNPTLEWVQLTVYIWYNKFNNTPSKVYKVWGRVWGLEFEQYVANQWTMDVVHLKAVVHTYSCEVVSSQRHRQQIIQSCIQ